MSGVSCPSCTADVNALRASPRVVRDERPQRAHIVAVYPCCCWIGVEQATAVAARLKAARSTESSDRSIIVSVGASLGPELVSNLNGA